LLTSSQTSNNNAGTSTTKWLHEDAHGNLFLCNSPLKQHHFNFEHFSHKKTEAHTANDIEQAQKKNSKLPCFVDCCGLLIWSLP